MTRPSWNTIFFLQIKHRAGSGFRGKPLVCRYNLRKVEGAMPVRSMGSKLGDPMRYQNGVPILLGSLLVTLLLPQIRPALTRPKASFLVFQSKIGNMRCKRFELHPVLRFLMLHKQNHDRLGCERSFNVLQRHLWTFRNYPIASHQDPI